MYLAAERDGFRRWLEARKVSPATVVIYMSAVTRFEAGHADVDLRAVTKQDIEAHAATLRDSGLASSAVASSAAPSSARPGAAVPRPDTRRSGQAHAARCAPSTVPGQRS